MQAAIFDTCLVSGLINNDSRIQRHLFPYLSLHGFLWVSDITRYEIERGILAIKNTDFRDNLLSEWEYVCQLIVFCPLDRAVLRCAAEIWASLGEGRSKQIGDADILIAATAVVHGCRVATVNTKDFSGIPGLDVWDVTIA